MFKEIRGLLQMLDEIDAEAAVEVPATPERDIIEPPQSVAAPAPVMSERPTSFIFDTDVAAAASLHEILMSAGVDTEIHDSAQSLKGAMSLRTPHLTFIDVRDQGDLAIDALFEMGGLNFGGGVQLMGAGPMAVMEVVKRMGQRHALQMLTPLKKPLDVHAVRGVLNAQGIKYTPVASAMVTLSEALANDWIEFWYQPKINLGKKQIAGVETFARVRHPELGTLPPSIFMQHASEADLMLLTQQALGAALAAARNFSQLGINLRVAVNMPVSALLTLPIADMLREHGPKHVRWPGLILDVTEAQVVGYIDRIMALSQDLSGQNVSFAIDDFSGGKLTLAQLTELPFAELKLDRNFVDGCAQNADRAKICASVIDLAHHLGCVAVGVGIERLDDMKALAGLGCDLGQGFLFGQPMPQEQLVTVMLKRAVAPERVKSAPTDSLLRARW
jgi:EAL domain-containing protein (putative c-di-GMP-specific phosphodiesterase class I)